MTGISKLLRLAFVVCIFAGIAAADDLKITSFPDGAQVTIDGVVQQKVTPLDVNLPDGQHVVSITVPGGGWIADTRTVNIVDGHNYLGVSLLPTLTVGPQGPKGDPGAPSTIPGPPGTANVYVVNNPGSIAVGTVTTAPPGTPASVVNAGTPTNALLNFVIPGGAAGVSNVVGPQGPKGDPGLPGASGAPPLPQFVQLNDFQPGNTGGGWVPNGGSVTLNPTNSGSLALVILSTTINVGANGADSCWEGYAVTGATSIGPSIDDAAGLVANNNAVSMGVTHIALVTLNAGTNTISSQYLTTAPCDFRPRNLVVIPYF